MQKTSKWQTHLPYLHLGTTLKTQKNIRIQPARGRHLGYPSLLSTCVESCGESPGSLTVGHSSQKQTKNKICQKNWLHDQ